MVLRSRFRPAPRRCPRAGQTIYFRTAPPSTHLEATIDTGGVGYAPGRGYTCLDCSSLAMLPLADSESGSPPPTLDIVLYVCPGSASSAKARRNLDAILQSYDPAAFHLTVRDVSRDLEDAEADHIVFTPTLIVRNPSAPCTMVGDLADTGAVALVLSMGGLEKCR
jgi:hypothetical protein